MAEQEINQGGGSPEFRFSPRPNRAAEIDWRPWGAGAFARAGQESRLVLLAISAPWCHWCHVMDETTYSDGEVIRLINENYIPVRVDSDRRPDINARYNQGGWPTLAFLTPAGELIGGTTYLPSDQMQKLLMDISGLYRAGSDQVTAAVEGIRRQRSEMSLPAAQPPDGTVAANLLEVIGDLYDQEYGGFGPVAKFPYPGVLNLLLNTLLDGYIETLDIMLRATLDAMATGGLYDRIEGGFFRYATERDWSSPHYEKLLEDNAALMSVYAQAFLLTGEQGYESVARDIGRYLAAKLLDPKTGAFAGSQDADETHYNLDASDREQKEPPAVDSTVYAGANCAAASSLLKLYQVSGDSQYHELALGALGFVWEQLWSGAETGQGVYHYFDGQAHLPGQLADAARLLEACMDAYETGAGELWLDRAIAVGGWLLKALEDDKDGGFYDGLPGPEGEGYLSQREKPLTENSVTAGGLIRLAQTTGQPRFGDAAARALACFGGVYVERGVLAAEYAVAVQRLLDPPVRVTIVGPPAEMATREMIRAAHRARIPFRSVEILDPEVHGEDLEATGYGYAGRPVAYICIGASCQPAVFDPGDLPERLEKGRRS
ncbi:MAG: thioredoxin domain-containing protein [Thermoleophilia bacterium]